MLPSVSYNQLYLSEVILSYYLIKSIIFALYLIKDFLTCIKTCMFSVILSGGFKMIYLFKMIII